MTLKQAALATLLAGGAAVALATTGRGPSTDHAASTDRHVAERVAVDPAAPLVPAPGVEAVDVTPAGAGGAAPDDARLAEAIAAAVAEAEADRLRLAAELAGAEAEKTRLAAALAAAETEAARLSAELEAALAAAETVAAGEAETVADPIATEAAPDLAALEAQLAQQTAEIARLTASLADRDAALAALEEDRKILGDLFDLAPMTAALAGPALGAGTATDTDSAAGTPQAAFPEALDAAKSSTPRARPTAMTAGMMTGRPVAEVHFDHGMSRLSPGGFERAREAARLIVALGVTRVRLSGHADTTGRAEANLRLSERRAEAVRAVLVAEGVPTAIIETEAHGQTPDALPVATAAGVAEPLNRRVGIYVETAVRTAALR